MRTPTCLLALTAAAIVSLGASAQSPATEPRKGEGLESDLAPALTMRDTRFDFLDIDGDGYLRHDEVPKDDAVLRSQFTSLDADNDGKLSRSEYVLSHRERIQ